MNESTLYQAIHIHPNDNIVIATGTKGIPKGEKVNNYDVIALDDIPMGHKMALVSIPKGSAVIRYGHEIGKAIRNIQSGEWVFEDIMETSPPPALDSLNTEVYYSWNESPLEGFTFLGYRNADGSVGTKNVLGISTSVQCVAGLCEMVVKKVKETLIPLYPNVDDVVALNHGYGCGVAIQAPAAIIPIRTIQNMAHNPNFGGEIMVLGLGCEKLRPEAITENAGEGHSITYMQDERFWGYENMVAGILEVAQKHLEKLNARHRESCPASALVVGMQCGGSDAFSGLTANPVAGVACDLLVRAGATVMFSEVTEVRDSIHLLVQRAENPEVAKALIREMAWYDDYLQAGEADRQANTSPGNKKGGLSTIIEKSLGSVVKSGRSPITDVVGPGERVRKKGLVFLATPASDFVCGTLQFAAGMNIHVFMTGRGTPYGLGALPVIKVSSNTTLAKRWFDLIDFNAGRLLDERVTIESLGWELFEYILDVASGKKVTCSDRLKLYNDFVLFNPGPLT